MKFRRFQHVIVQSIGDESLAYDGTNGFCHTMNETAGWILSVSDKLLSLENLVELANERYILPVGDNIGEDIKQIVIDMQAKNLLEVHFDKSE